MSESSDFVGKIVKTDIGNLKIKSAEHIGLATKNVSEGRLAIKKLKVKTECGSEFTTDYFSLKDSLAM